MGICSYRLRDLQGKRLIFDRTPEANLLITNVDDQWEDQYIHLLLLIFDYYFFVPENPRLCVALQLVTQIKKLVTKCLYS